MTLSQTKLKLLRFGVCPKHNQKLEKLIDARRIVSFIFVYVKLLTLPSEPIFEFMSFPNDLAPLKTSVLHFATIFTGFLRISCWKNATNESALAVILKKYL